MKPETVVTQVGDVTSPDVSERRGLERIEVIGLGLLGIGLLTLLISPGILANGFDILIDSVQPVVVDVFLTGPVGIAVIISVILGRTFERLGFTDAMMRVFVRSEEHTSELQSRGHLVCRLLLEKKKKVTRDKNED